MRPFPSHLVVFATSKGEQLYLQDFSRCILMGGHHNPCVALHNFKWDWPGALQASSNISRRIDGRRSARSDVPTAPASIHATRHFLKVFKIEKLVAVRRRHVISMDVRVCPPLGSFVPVQAARSKPRAGTIHPRLEISASGAVLPDAFWLAKVAAVDPAFVFDLIRAVRLRSRIERLPAGLAIGIASAANVDRRSVKNGLILGARCIFYPSRDQSTAAANAFRVNIRLVFGDTGVGKRPDDAARGRACSCANSRGDKPTCCHHGTNARNGQHAQPGQKTGRASESRSDAGACSGTFGSVVDTVFAIYRLIVPTAGVVGDNADIGVWNAGGLKIDHRLVGFSIIIVKSRDCRRHRISPLLLGRVDVAFEVDADIRLGATLRGGAAPDALVVLF